jgi:NAD(P)-dependent dehydrogenase (short-subunit alcohol dehydrogenase family)
VGRATALSYAKAGASTIIIAARSSLTSLIDEVKNAAKSVGKPEPKVLAIKLDVTSVASVEAAAQTAEKEVASLDILINNAGYLEKWVPIADSDAEEYWTSFTTNYKGTYLVTRSFLPLVLASSTKVILNIVSAGAHRVAFGASAYQTSKLALCRFTEFTVNEYGKEGVIAIAVHPGGVDTELARGMPVEMQKMVLVDKAEMSGDALVWYGGERREWLSGRYVSSNWDVGELEGKKEKILKEDLLKVRMAVGF